MRKTILLSLICTFLASCGGSNEEGSGTVLSQKTSGIPLPSKEASVDPNVANLFRKTVADLKGDKYEKHLGPIMDIVSDYI